MGIENASPAELIEMLYGRAISDLKAAHELLGKPEAPRSSADAIHLIVHAQQIVAELNRCLNMKDGKELAKNLSQLYDYVQFRLTDSVSRRDKEPVGEVIGLLTELHDAWKSMIDKQLKAKG